MAAARSAGGNPRIEIEERTLVPQVPATLLPAEDGEPLESPWHRAQINLLIELVQRHWRGRTDSFAGGNMFLHYSARQARDRDYKGPDFFVVRPTDGQRPRDAWIVWEEDGRYPNLIVELLSPTTAENDLGPKKVLYERTFKTPEYFCLDRETSKLQGWRLGEPGYLPVTPDRDGRLPSRELELSIGLWAGIYQNISATWARLYDSAGTLVPTAEERAAAAGV
ncbi:MAG: Uma2 family endonuclease [Planctomycetes bacterium]|nr:Uma2 family endonuclease [Planctomycetota bacterium]